MLWIKFTFTCFTWNWIILHRWNGSTCSNFSREVWNVEFCKNVMLENKTVKDDHCFFASAVAKQQQRYAIDCYVSDCSHLEMMFCDVLTSGWVRIKDAGYEVLVPRRALCLKKSVVVAVFIQNVSVVKGDHRIMVRGEEVRIYIIVVILVDGEMFRDLTGFLLQSLGGQVYVREFISSHRSQRVCTEKNFDQTWSMKKIIVPVEKLKEATVLLRISLQRKAKALVKVHLKDITNEGVAMPVYCRRSLNSSPKIADIWLLALPYESGAAFRCCWTGSDTPFNLCQKLFALKF